MHLAVALQFLHELGQQHGILAAGDAHGDPVALLNQLMALHSQNKMASKAPCDMVVRMLRSTR